MTAPQLTDIADAGGPPGADRAALRRRLLEARAQFAAGPSGAAAQHALTLQLTRLLRELEPSLLGTYWPVRGEFDPGDAVHAAVPAIPSLALPFARREPHAMHYRRWDGARPDATDDCGLPAPGAAAMVVPDVVLVPCVGFTRAGERLGYGGGYFDRSLAALAPRPKAIGVGFELGRVSSIRPQPHDLPMDFIVTEAGAYEVRQEGLSPFTGKPRSG